MARSSAWTLLLLLGLSACRGEGEQAPATGARSTSAQDQDAGLTVLDGWPDPQAQSEVTLPWTLEAQADVVAVGVAGRPVERGGRTLLTLRLDDVLYGDAAVGAVFPADEAPFFGCLPPASLPRPSETYPPGTKLLIYLTKAGPRLSILLLSALPTSLEGLGGFLDLRRALDEAQPRWDSLLKLGPPGREEQLSALYDRPPESPGAAAALGAHFLGLLDRLEAADAAKRPDVEAVLRRAGVLRRQAEPTCLDALGRLVDWLLSQGMRDRVPDAIPLARGFTQATQAQRAAWEERAARLEAHEDLRSAGRGLRGLLAR